MRLFSVASHYLAKAFSDFPIFMNGSAIDAAINTLRITAINGDSGTEEVEVNSNNENQS